MTSLQPFQRLLLPRIANPGYQRLLRQSQPQTRAFTSSHCNRKGNAFLPQVPKQKHAAQKSIGVMMDEQRKALQDSITDFGLIPETFIMPTGTNLPSPQYDFTARWKLEKRRLIQRGKDFLTRMVFKYIYVRPRPNFETSKIPTIAKALYEQMYTSFAHGNLGPISSSLTENITTKLQSRIDARPLNTTMKWTLHRYISRPRLVSHRYIPLDPTQKNKWKQSTLQQCVVKIRSEQSLERCKRVRGAAGKVEDVVEEGSNTIPKKVTEYFVIQRIMRKGKQGDWMVWGTTQETRLEDLDEV